MGLAYGFFMVDFPFSSYGLHGYGVNPPKPTQLTFARPLWIEGAGAIYASREGAILKRRQQKGTNMGFFVRISESLPEACNLSRRRPDSGMARYRSRSSRPGVACIGLPPGVRRGSRPLESTPALNFRWLTRVSRRLRAAKPDSPALRPRRSRPCHGNPRHASPCLLTRRVQGRTSRGLAASRWNRRQRKQLPWRLLVLRRSTRAGKGSGGRLARRRAPRRPRPLDCVQRNRPTLERPRGRSRFAPS